MPHLRIYLTAHRNNYAKPVLFGDYETPEALLDGIRDAVNDKADFLQIRVMRWNEQPQPSRGTKRPD